MHCIIFTTTILRSLHFIYRQSEISHTLCPHHRNKVQNFMKLKCNHGITRYVLYTITLITMFVPTHSVRYVILFREMGVVHRITHSLSFFLLLVLFPNIILNLKKRRAVSSQKQIMFY